MAQLPRRGAPALKRVAAASALLAAACHEAPAARQDVASKLAALPYASRGRQASDAGGVLRLDPGRAQAGYTLVVGFAPGPECMAELVDLEGRRVRCWPGDGTYWLQASLRPGGRLVVVGKSDERRPRYSYVASWSPEGTREWQRTLPVHHDIEPGPDGGYLVLLRRLRNVPGLSEDTPLSDSTVGLLSSHGRLLEERSLFDALGGSLAALGRSHTPDPEAATGRWLDALHANSVAWIPAELVSEDDPVYAEDSVLVCLRHQDSLVAFQWGTGRSVWQWGQGVLSGPHDASWLPDGNLLVFDNGLGRDWARVVEVDPRTGRIAWEYRDESLYTVTRGSAQRLDNGNTLISVAESGRVLEVTRDGEVVWDWAHTYRDAEGRVAIVQHARRYDPTVLDPPSPTE